MSDPLESVHEHAPDLIFLDSDMLECDGFASIAALPDNVRPSIVFVTAHDRHLRCAPTICSSQSSRDA